MSACGEKDNEIDLTKTKERTLSGADVQPEKVKIDDNKLEVAIKWVYGSENDSMDKSSFADLGVDVSIFQNGNQIIFDPKLSSNLYENSYEGSESTVYFGFPVNKDEDTFELTISEASDYSSPGYFFNFPKNKSSEKEIKRQNYLIFYKRILNHNMSNFISFLKAMESGDVEDSKFIADELKKDASKMVDIKIDDFDDLSLNKLVNKLSTKYIDIADTYLSIDFNNIPNDLNDIMESRGAEIGAVTKEIAEKFYDGELPESVKRL